MSVVWGVGADADDAGWLQCVQCQASTVYTLCAVYSWKLHASLSGRHRLFKYLRSRMALTSDK